MWRRRSQDFWRVVPLLWRSLAGFINASLLYSRSIKWFNLAAAGINQLVMVPILTAEPGVSGATEGSESGTNVATTVPASWASPRF